MLFTHLSFLSFLWPKICYEAREDRSTGIVVSVRSRFGNDDPRRREDIPRSRLWSRYALAATVRAGLARRWNRFLANSDRASQNESRRVHPRWPLSFNARRCF